MRRHFPDALDDLCEFVAKKYDGVGSLEFFYRDKEILIMGKELSKISNEDIIDWMTFRWGIFLNVRTSITGSEVRFDYWMDFKEKGELLKTPLEHGFESYNSLINHACKTAVKAIGRRVKG